MCFYVRTTNPYTYPASQSCLGGIASGVEPAGRRSFRFFVRVKDSIDIGVRLNRKSVLTAQVKEVTRGKWRMGLKERVYIPPLAYPHFLLNQSRYCVRTPEVNDFIDKEREKSEGVNHSLIDGFRIRLPREKTFLHNPLSVFSSSSPPLGRFRLRANDSD